MINILFIIDCYKDPYAGTEGQLLKLIRGLDRSRFNPVMVILRESFYYKESDIPVTSDIPVPADVLNISGLSSIASWLKLYRYLRKRKAEGFTIAHTYFFDSAMICPPVLKLLGYKVVVSRRDMGYWYTTMTLQVLRFNSLLVDRVVANSEAVKAVTMRKEHYPAGRIAVIYNGYQEAGKEVHAETPDVPIRDGEFRIVLVANIRPIKRIQDAVQALCEVRDMVQEAALYVIGDGDGTALEVIAEQCGIGDRVHFLGPRDDILEILPMFDLGILCSESEGFSNTIIEYLQSGLPVVCSNVGGNPEIIDDGINGYLYRMGDTCALAAAIEKLAKDDSLQRRMGKAGRNKVTENYSLDKYVSTHERLYEELLAH